MQDRAFRWHGRRRTAATVATVSEMMTNFSSGGCAEIRDPQAVAGTWVSSLRGISLSPEESELVLLFEDCADTQQALPVYVAALELAPDRATFTAIGWQHIQHYLLYAALDDSTDRADTGSAMRLIDALAKSMVRSRAFGVFAAEWISVAANEATPWAGAILAAALADRLELPWEQHLDALRAEWLRGGSIPLPLQVPAFFGDPSVPRNVLATLDAQAALAVSRIPDLPPEVRSDWERWAGALTENLAVVDRLAQDDSDGHAATDGSPTGTTHGLMVEGAGLIRSMTAGRRGPTARELRRAVELVDPTMPSARWPLWGAIREVLLPQSIDRRVGPEHDGSRESESAG